MKKIMITLLSIILIATGCTSKKEEPELTIYLVRHGKTHFNTTEQVQGFADSPLTDVGIEQAHAVGKGLKDIEFIGSYSSDLGRQRNTLKGILAENEKTVPEMREHDGFKEWNYGGFEGKTNAEMWTPVMAPYGLTFDEDWTDYPALVEILGDKGVADAIHNADPLKLAETYEQIETRGKAALDQIISDFDGKKGNILVVSSGSMIPSLLEIAVPGEYKGESIGNGSVTILKYKDGAYTLDVIGDKSYVEAQ